MNRYFVEWKLHNKENGGWAFKTEKNTDNYDEAVKSFHSSCATYIGTNPFDHVLVYIMDAFGNILKKEVWDAPVVVTEPETENSIDELEP